MTWYHNKEECQLFLWFASQVSERHFEIQKIPIKMSQPHKIHFFLIILKPHSGGVSLSTLKFIPHLEEN